MTTAPPIKRRKISRIALKFSAVVCVIIILIMTLMASLILKQTRTSLTKEMEIRAKFFARDVRESLFPEPDSFQLYFSVKEIVKEKAILYAMVVDDEGKIMSHSDRERIGGFDKSSIGMNALQANTVISQPYTLRDQELYDIAVPIIVGETHKVGTIRIGFSRQSIALALQEKTREIIKISIALLAIGIFVTIIVVNIIVSPVNKLAYAAVQIGHGNLNQEIKIKSRDELGELAQTFNGMVQGLKERDFIRNTFGKYVTKQVAEAILNGRLELGGEKRTVTILMSDIRSFTRMSENMQPEEVVDFLNRYFTLMVDVVVKYEGTLDKFIGDAILAVFGAPVSHDDDPQRAVKVALEMSEELKRFNHERLKENKEPINIGIAVHTGEVLAGNIGSEVRMEYTVIGDTVNLTSRLESLNKEYNSQIIISEETYKAVRDIVEVREIAPVKVRGKEKSTLIYELLGLK